MKKLGVLFLQLLLGSAIILGIAILVTRGCSGKGIITLKDYPHAVIVCGEGLTVNHGHYWDKEVPELVKLAEELCPKR